MTLARAAVLVVLLMILACGQAMAQLGGSRRSRDSGSHDSSGGPNPGSEVTRMSANDRVRLQLADLRFALKLAPEQNAPFDAFQGRVLALITPHPAASDFAAAQQPAALAKVAQKVSLARGRWAEMQDIYDSAAKLYAVLTDEQKAIADRMLADAVPAPFSAAVADSGDGGTRSYAR